MNVHNILLAMEELERWEKRKATLEGNLLDLRDEVRRGVINELRTVNTQISYYQDLIRDMKMRINPPCFLHMTRK